MLGIFNNRRNPEESGIFCPYCLRDIGKKKLRCKCLQCDKEVVPDKEGKCPDCGHIVAQICKWNENGTEQGCGRTLPDGYTDIKSTLIAVAGAKQVGKTQYLSELIQYIGRNHFSDEFAVALSAMDEHTREFLEKCTKMNMEGYVVPETDPIYVMGHTKDPLIFTFVHYSNSNSRVAESIVVYDVAGDDLMRGEIRSTMIPAYLQKADSIFFFMDPLQVDLIRSNIENDKVKLPLADELHNNESAFDRVCSAIGTTKDHNSSKRLCMIMTKCDLLTKDFPTSDESKYVFDGKADLFKGRRYGSVDIDNLDAVSTYMESYLRKIGQGSIVNKVSINFKNYHYFATSALGQNPEGGEILTEIVPFRIEDPLLWALYSCGSKVVTEKER